MKEKILIVLTNTGKYGDSFEKTGLWLGEATEFVDEVSKAGFMVDYVSPKGGKVPIDPRSLEKKYVKDRDLEILESTDFKDRALVNSLSAKDINAKDYLAIYYTGGHGVLWDFPDDFNLQVLASDIYNKGGYLTSVCHGIAGMLNLRNMKGEYFIKDKSLTGFTNAEELIGGKAKKVPFFTENEARKRGADFKQDLPYTSFAIQDGRIITGQNPQSAREVAKILVDNLS